MTVKRTTGKTHATGDTNLSECYQSAGVSGCMIFSRVLFTVMSLANCFLVVRFIFETESLCLACPLLKVNLVELIELNDWHVFC